MGTNFYIREKLNEEQKNQIIDLINNDKYEEAKSLLPNLIHIGKRSCGWKFLWDVHNFEYFNDEQSLIDFVNNGQIVDEYNTEFTPEEFWNKEINDFLDSGCDIAQYYTENRNEYQYTFESEITRFKRLNDTSNIHINKFGEFYLGKFRCTINENFG